MELLYAIPPLILLAFALSVSLALALTCQSLVHRAFRRVDFVAHNEIGGIIIVVVASLYAVLLGFLTAVAWEHFQEAREIVVQEADANIDAWHTVVGLPAPLRQRVRQDVLEYADIMVDREWAAMRRGRFDPQAAMISMDALDVVGGYVPKNPGETNAQSATLQQLAVMHDARQRRIEVNDSGLSGFEWSVLLLGAACVVCFCWLFGGSGERIHLMMTATVVVIVVSTLVLLFELQYPFRSGIRIGTGAWGEAVDHIRQMMAGPMADMRM